MRYCKNKQDAYSKKQQEQNSEHIFTKQYSLIEQSVVNNKALKCNSVNNLGRMMGILKDHNR